MKSPRFFLSISNSFYIVYHVRYARLLIPTLSGFERIVGDLFSGGYLINIPAFWKLRGGAKVVIHRCAILPLAVG